MWSIVRPRTTAPSPFRQSATSSYWRAQTLGEHVYFFSGTSLIYEYTVHRLLDVNEDDVPPLEDSLTNYPNPFNPTTTIAFSLAEKSSVELSIYNIRGQKIKTLVTGMVDSGEHRIEWDGTGQHEQATIFRRVFLPAKDRRIRPGQKDDLD